MHGLQSERCKMVRVRFKDRQRRPIECYGMILSIISAKNGYVDSSTQHNHFTALWTLSGATRVRRYQRYISPSSGFSGAKWRWHRQTHQQSRWTATPSRLIGAPTSVVPTIFMQDALPYTTLPIYPGLGQAPNMLACISSGLVMWTVVSDRN